MRSCKVANLSRTIERHPECRAIEGIGEEELTTLLSHLEAEYLIERREIKGEPHVGLTDDGRRCNLITVY